MRVKNCRSFTQFSHFLTEKLIIGLHRRSHSVNLQCLGHTLYHLQPGYHLPDFSSHVHTPSLISGFFALLHHLEIGILSSYSSTYLLHPELSSSPELPHRAVMQWLSNLPISEAQEIEGSAHHGHTRPRKLCLGANAPQHHVVPGHTKQTFLLASNALSLNRP